MRAAILNITGYGGAELARIIARHPEMEVVAATGRSAAGSRLAEVFPHLSDIDIAVTADLEAEADIVFSALPHAASAERVVPLLEAGARVVDFSADFRLRSAAEYSAWYGIEHPSPQRLDGAVYGIPELARSAVRGAQLVANPGCYPTAAILALAPAVEASLIAGDVVIDAKSGVSGAGRGASLATHYSEANESVRAYSVAGHRHMPEIVQQLGAIGPAPRVTFLAHLVPMTRGILVSCYAPLSPQMAEMGEAAASRVAEVYAERYRGEPFVTVTAAPPATKHTLGSNMCLVHPTVDARTGTLIVIACIDNLVKGAAGQAVQNANVMLGLSEEAGLGQLALYP